MRSAPIDVVMMRETIFTTAVTTGSYVSFLDEMIRLADGKKSAYVCFANAHMVVESYRDAHFNRVVNEADIVTPDGKPLSVFLRLFKKIKQDRVCGMDVLPDLLRKAADNGKSVYFYGTTDAVLQQISDKANHEFPSLRIAGTYSPPFRTLSAEEKTDIINMINGTTPDFVFVALGCPKQEKWMAEHKGKINACMLGLGQAFQVYAGLEKRLPKWMRDLSLEWVYRFYLEPRRLWKRYFYTNSIFLFLTCRYAVRAAFGLKPL